MTTTTNRKETEIGIIPQDWEVLKLGELVNIRRWASPRPIIDYMTINWWMPWVKIADATSSQTRYIDKTNEYIKEEWIKNSVVVVPWDLILSNSATPGLPKIMKIKACIHDWWLLISDFKWIIKEYLYYFFLKFREELAWSANWSVFQNLKTDIVRDVNIPLPPPHEQKAIATTLWSLDDKIELLKEQNKTLENMGQAIFKSWFVDFEWQEFMVESEMGMIPKGWKVGKLGDLCDIGSWKRPNNKSDKQDDEHKIPLMWASWVMAYTSDTLFNEHILIIWRVGTHWQVKRINFPCRPSDNTLILKSDFFEYVYQILIWIDYTSLNRWAVQPLITQTDMRNYEILIPDTDILNKFENSNKSLYESIYSNNEQIESLIQTRDNLLPRLMSGKIRTL